MSSDTIILLIIWFCVYVQVKSSVNKKNEKKYCAQFLEFPILSPQNTTTPAQNVKRSPNFRMMTFTIWFHHFFYGYIQIWILSSMQNTKQHKKSGRKMSKACIFIRKKRAPLPRFTRFLVIFCCFVLFLAESQFYNYLISLHIQKVVFKIFL